MSHIKTYSLECLLHIFVAQAMDFRCLYDFSRYVEWKKSARSASFHTLNINAYTQMIEHDFMLMSQAETLFLNGAYTQAVSLMTKVVGFRTTEYGPTDPATEYAQTMLHMCSKLIPFRHPIPAFMPSRKRTWNGRLHKQLAQSEAAELGQTG